MAVRKPTDLTVRAWWHALRDAAKSFQDKSLTDDGRGAHLLLGALDLPGADRARLAARRGRLAGVDRRACCGSPRTSARLGRRHAAAARSRTSSTTPAAPASRWSSASLAALWSASGYIGAFIRASNEIYEVEEDRPFWKLRPLQLLITLVMTVAGRGDPVALVLTGPLATAIGEELGLGDTALTIWSIAKWPLLFVAVVTVIGLLYRVSPNTRHEGLRWILPGQPRRDRPLARRLGRVQLLRRQLRLLLEHLRQPRRRRSSSSLALAHQRRGRLRRPVRRRARARPRTPPASRRRPGEPVPLDPARARPRRRTTRPPPARG